MNTDFFESWLLALLIRGAVIVGLWSIVAFLFRKASADRLSAWWRCGALSLLIVAFTPWTAARWWIPVKRSTPIVSVDDFPGSEPRLVKTSIPSSTASGHEIEPMGHSLSWWTWIWMIGAAAMLARLCASLHRVRAIISSAKPLSDSIVTELLNAECRDAGIRRDVAIKSHSSVDTPFAAGLFHPVIVVPDATERIDTVSLKLMLRHEVAHVARFDVLWQMIAEVAVTLHWVNPLAWFLRRRLRLAHEAAADDIVLAGGVDGPVYASVLFGMSCHDSRLSGEACLASMARVSTLRRRIGFILDASRKRNALGAITGTALLLTSCAAALVFGLTGLRAQETAPALKTPLTEESWTRSYRDTFRLERSFADRFTGTGDEAIAAFQKELVGAGMPLSNSIKFELSPDKATLRVEFTEKDRDSVEAKLIPLIHQSGWWKDAHEVRSKAVAKELSALSDELAAQKKAVATAAAEMATTRQAYNIADSDPENSNGLISTPDRGIVKLEREVRERGARVKKIDDEIEWLNRQDPMSLRQALRMMEIEDPRMEKTYTSIEEMKAQDAGLEVKGVAKSDPEREELRARIELQKAVIARAFENLKGNRVALAEVERSTLAKYDESYKEAAAKQIEDKKRTIEYTGAKARYLNNKKIYEVAEWKFLQEQSKRTTGQSMPRSR